MLLKYNFSSRLNLIGLASLPKLPKNITFRDFARNRNREFDGNDFGSWILKITSTGVESSAPAGSLGKKKRKTEDDSDEESPAVSHGEEVCVFVGFFVLIYLSCLVCKLGSVGLLICRTTRISSQFFLFHCHLITLSLSVSSCPYLSPLPLHHPSLFPPLSPSPSPDPPSPIRLCVAKAILPGPALGLI
jgi:hypothetical protein